MKQCLFLIWIICIGLSFVTADAATYYVSPSGSDTNGGTTPAAAWQTLAQVNSQKFSPGDQILFQSGQTFTAASGKDGLIISGSGTATNPVTYGIYSGTTPGIVTGTTPAVISQTSSSHNGVSFSSTNAWVTLQDLEIAGPFVWSSTTATVAVEIPCGIKLSGSTTTPLMGTTI